MSSEFRFAHATPDFRTFCGNDALSALPRELTRFGVTSVAVICNPSIRQHSLVFDRVERVLADFRLGVFDAVQPATPIPVVFEAAEFLARTKAEAVIAVGSGSAIVTARAASIVHAEGTDLRALSTRRGPDGAFVSPRLEAAKLPQWVIPSTPTTAYAKAGTAVRDPESGDRLALFDPKTLPKGIFLDPAMAATAPTRLVRSAALNALTAAIEGLQSSATDPIADGLLTHGLRLVSESLQSLSTSPNTSEPRLQLMVAALLCGQGTNYKGGGLAQTIAHSVTKRSTAHNGEVEALLLPHTIKFTSPSTDRRLDQIVSDLGIAATAGSGTELLANLVNRLLAECKTPTTLREVGVEREDLDVIAQEALDDWFISRVPRPPTFSDLTKLLNEAW